MVMFVATCEMIGMGVVVFRIYAVNVVVGVRMLSQYRLSRGIWGLPTAATLSQKEHESGYQRSIHGKGFRYRDGYCWRLPHSQYS